MDVGAWLRSLDLGQYEQVFRDNAIDPTLLPTLTAEDLREIGVTPLGHRKRLLEAIAALREDSARQGVPAPNTFSRPLPTSPDEQAERRQITVMFVDLVGSTALASRLDPEEMRELIRSFQDRVAGNVARFDGHLAKFMGDGALAYFGWPQAHEDDAERAARAGLSVVAAIADLRTPSGEALAARAGIATGLVVVGDLIGRGEARERAVVGEAPNLAARLQAVAKPGTVVVDEPTRQLLNGVFEIDGLGPTPLKGIAEPVGAFTLGAEKVAPSRFDAHSAAVRPLVGRESELGLLVQRWRQARAGEGQGVLLLGEAGIGKSRIVRALTDALQAEDHVCLRYQGSPLHTDQALWPVGQQLSFAAGFDPNDDDHARLEKLGLLLTQAAEVDPDTLLLITSVTGLVTADVVTTEATPRQRLERTLAALLDQLLGWARQRPVLVVVEDAHWLDPTTLELFGQALGRTARMPVLILLTSRPDTLPQLSTHPHLTRLTLNRLSREATARITSDVVGTPLPPHITEMILDRADGVPLYAEELARAVLDARTDDELDHPLHAGAVVPLSLQGSLMARLDRLGPAKEVAQTAACIGREFDHALLAEVTALPKADLTQAMDRLASAELVFRRGTPPEVQYTFKHALLRDAAHESLLRTRRRSVHQRIADVLDQAVTQGAEVSPEVLAYHCEEAGAPEAATRHWLAAGKRNARRGANVEAIRCLERALRNLKKLPDTIDAKRLELDVQQARVPVLMSFGIADQQTAESAERALALCEELEVTDRVLPLLFSQFSYCMALARLRQALEIAHRIVGLGESSGETLPQLVGHRAVGFCWSRMGDLPVAERELETAVRLAGTVEAPDLAFEFGHDLGITARAYLGDVKLLRGELAHGRRLAAEALDDAKRLDHTLTLAVILRNTSVFEALVGNCHKAQTLASALRDLCVERDVRQWRYLGELLSLWASFRAGQDVTLDQIWEAFERQQESGFLLDTPVNLMLVAEACFAAGDHGRSDRMLQEALTLVEATGEIWVRPELHRRRACCALAATNASTQCAERWLSNALHEARRQGNRVAELRVSHDLARLWVERSECWKAQDLLAPTCGWLAECSDLHDLPEARALLDAPPVA